MEKRYKLKGIRFVIFYVQNENKLLGALSSGLIPITLHARVKRRRIISKKLHKYTKKYHSYTLERDFRKAWDILRFGNTEGVV